MSGVFNFPPVDPSLAGYTAPTGPNSYNLRAFGVGEGAAASGTPSTAMSLVNSSIEGLEKSGAGVEPVKSALAGKLENLGSGVSILGDLANIYFGFQQQKQARRAFQGQMGFANANLENTVKSYNTRLADLYKARGFTQGDSSDATNQAINSNSLNFKTIRA